MVGTRSRRGLDETSPQTVAAAVVVALVLCLQSFVVHAELLFRRAEQVDGQQRWSGIRNYGIPSDTSYTALSADGAAMPTEEVRVFLSGVITHADVSSAAVMASLVERGRQRIAGNTVWLAGNGGDIDAGMALGRTLRKLGIFTRIAENDQCLSACVFAFMGGERRSVAGRLGIHRPYFPSTEDAPDRAARFRHLQNTLKDFVEELDFPESLYEAVMLVPPESMQIVTPADLKRFYLDGISPSSEDKADAASARRLGLSMFDYLQRKAKAPACAFPSADLARCEGEAQAATASGGATADPAQTLKGDAASAGRAVGHGGRGS